MKRYVLIALACMSFSISSGQGLRSPFILNVDYAKFRYDEKSLYLEVYYGFYPQLLTFLANENGFHASISLSIAITEATSGAIFSRRDLVVPVETPDTSKLSQGVPIISQLGLAIPFGTYSLSVLAIDSFAPSRRDSIALSLSVQPFPSSVALSDLELCSNIRGSKDETNHFYKNTLEVIPNPMLTFGVTGSPVLFSYMEMYNLIAGESYTLKSEILDGGGKVIREGSRTRTPIGATSVDVATMNVTSYPSGRYKLRLTVFTGGKEIAQREKMFYLYNPHVEQPTPTAVAIKANELAGLDGVELEGEFRKAQYVATQQEIGVFNQITNEEGRRMFLAKFWSEVERGKLGNAPISRVEYLARIDAATKKFQSFSREGWRSDRGRVIVLYGEPDEIDRVPSSDNARPLEIWRYFNLENGVEFVFVDRTGFGDYQLVHSTKRGELRDDSWERYLR
jgi:GWxTD domain-containing protein